MCDQAAPTESTTNCVLYHLVLIKSGRLLAELRTPAGMMAAVSCLGQAAITLLTKAVAQDNRGLLTRGDDVQIDQILELADGLGIAIPHEGPISSALLLMLFEQLLAKASEIVRDYFDR